MYALKNLKQTSTFEIKEPWSEWSNFSIPDTIKDKKTFEKWRTAPDTGHAFISGIRGIDPAARVSSTDKDDLSAAAFMSDLIIDYDTPVSDERVDVLMKDPPCPVMPSHVIKSFSKDKDGNHKRRLHWAFEREIRFLSADHAKRFLKLLSDKLQLSKWLAGMDRASLNPGLYFEIGTDWKPVSAKPIPHATLLGWLAESASGLQSYSESGDRPVVPVEKIAELVADVFPGRWQGDFHPGAQGPRFWDPEADNPRGALVGDHGMICFTGPKPFVPWEEIFGSDRIDELRGDTWGKYLDNTWFVDGKYYCWDGKQRCYFPVAKEDMRMDLKLAGVSDRKSRTTGTSDVDRLMGLIRSNNRVEAALPFIHHPQGEYWEEGRERFLNVARYEVLQPGPDIDGSAEYDWDLYGMRHFPWIKEFMGAFFAPSVKNPKWIPSTVPQDRIQLYLLLAWLKRVYIGALQMDPPMRQGLVIAGPAGAGKTFFVSGVLAALLGAVGDASAYLVEGSQFNAHLADKPIMSVDDSSPADSIAGHRKYTSIFKRLTANALMPYNKKHASQGMVIWKGSLIVCCNLDPESLRVIPGMDQTNKEKMLLFKAQTGVSLPGESKQREFLKREMPMFARFLLGWEPPDWTLAPGNARGRYGVRAYHFAELKAEVTATGSVQVVLGALQTMYEEWMQDDESVRSALSGLKPTDPEEQEYIWRGRTGVLHTYISLKDIHIAKMSAAGFNGCLGALAGKGFPIKKEGQKWEIKFNSHLLGDFDEEEE